MAAFLHLYHRSDSPRREHHTPGECGEHVADADHSVAGLGRESVAAAKCVCTHNTHTSPATAQEFALPPSIVQLSPLRPALVPPVCPHAPHRPPSAHSTCKSLGWLALEGRFDAALNAASGDPFGDSFGHAVGNTADNTADNINTCEVQALLGDPHLGALLDDLAGDVAPPMLPTPPLPMLQMPPVTDDVEGGLAKVHHNLAMPPTNVALGHIELHAPWQAP